jgi:peptidase A4-like protein
MCMKSLALPSAGLLVLLTGLGTLPVAGAHAPRAASAPRSARHPLPPQRRGMSHDPHIPGPRYDTSQNWSGYVVTGSGVTHVQGSWTIPSVVQAPDCPNAYSATWVGIDGWDSNTVEQLGTEQDWYSGGSHYYAWYEIYPKGSATIPYSVSPGDHITAAVDYDPQTGVLTLSMDDGWHFETTQTLKRAQRTSAEWIEEAPFSGGILPLADFGTVDFANCSSTLGGPGAGIPVTMVSKFRGPHPQHNLAEPVSAGSDSATIKWDACQ